MLGAAAMSQMHTQFGCMIKAVVLQNHHLSSHAGDIQPAGSIEAQAARPFE